MGSDGEGDIPNPAGLLGGGDRDEQLLGGPDDDDVMVIDQGGEGSGGDRQGGAGTEPSLADVAAAATEREGDGDDTSEGIPAEVGQ